MTYLAIVVFGLGAAILFIRFRYNSAALLRRANRRYGKTLKILDPNVVAKPTLTHELMTSDKLDYEFHLNAAAGLTLAYHLSVDLLDVKYGSEALDSDAINYTVEIQAMAPCCYDYFAILPSDGGLRLGCRLCRKVNQTFAPGPPSELVAVTQPMRLDRPDLTEKLEQLLGVSNEPDDVLALAIGASELADQLRLMTNVLLADWLRRRQRVFAS